MESMNQRMSLLEQKLIQLSDEKSDEDSQTSSKGFRMFG